jgi:hypothetical protein
LCRKARRPAWPRRDNHDGDGPGTRQFLRRATASPRSIEKPAPWGVHRAATRTTALSQHCPCGARVEKRLGDRIHHCPTCSLRGDRDAVAAVLASFVVFAQPGESSSAQVDYAAAAKALPAIQHTLSIPSSPFGGWQDTLSESTDLFAREALHLTSRMSTPAPVAVARRTLGMAPCPTLDETGSGQTTPERASTRTNTCPTTTISCRICGTHLGASR